LSVTHDALVPIPKGPTNSLSKQYVEWASAPSDGLRALTAVPGGVEMNVLRPGFDVWQQVPVSTLNPSVVVQGDAQFVAGGYDSGIGLGCQNQGTGGYLGFFVHYDQSWTLLYLPPDHGAVQLLDGGNSTEIRSTGTVNSLTVSCTVTPYRGRGTQVMAAVNGETVLNEVVGTVSTGLAPMINQCACEGADTGRFTNISVFSP
jgi:hypothetical protein